MSLPEKRHSSSEFTRDKLDRDYNPMLHNERFRHFVDKNRKKSFLTQVREQLNTSTKAIKELKQGRYLQIDLNTRSNFRAVTELRTQADEDVDFIPDKYKKVTDDLEADLAIIKDKKKVLFEKIKARKKVISLSRSVQLPTVDKILMDRVPPYKRRLLKMQKEFVKMYPLKYLKPQLLEKFHEIYTEMI